MKYTFEAELWRWEARRELWTFLSLPPDASEEITEVAGELRGGFQSVRVDVTIGSSHWRTSIFAAGTEDGTYWLPIKKKVREDEGLVLGDTVTATLELVDF